MVPWLTLAGPAPSLSADFLALSCTVSASFLRYLAVCCLLNLGLGPCSPQESFHLYLLPHQWRCGPRWPCRWRSSGENPARSQFTRFLSLRLTHLTQIQPGSRQQ